MTSTTFSGVGHGLEGQLGPHLGPQDQQERRREHHQERALSFVVVAEQLRDGPGIRVARRPHLVRRQGRQTKGVGPAALVLRLTASHNRATLHSARSSTRTSRRTVLRVMVKKGLYLLMLNFVCTVTILYL